MKDNSLDIESPILIIENHKSPTPTVDAPINNRDIDSILHELNMEYVFYITSFFKGAHTDKDKSNSIEQLHKQIDTLYSPSFRLMLKSEKKSCPPPKQSSIFVPITKNILFPMFLLIMLSTLTK